MNIFKIPDALPDEEWFETLLEKKEVVIERIISIGQRSPDGFWYDQEDDEWVILLQGKAHLQWEDGSLTVMNPGDFVLIPAHQKHRVAFTSSNPYCIWVAVHLSNEI